MSLLIVPGNNSGGAAPTALRIPRDAYDPLRDRATDMGVTEDALLKMILYMHTTELVDEINQAEYLNGTDAAHALEELTSLVRTLPPDAFYEISVTLPPAVNTGLLSLASHYKSNASILATLFISLHFMSDLTDEDLEDLGMGE